MSEGGEEYIFDWWFTLDIFNPIIFHYEDWRLYPLPGILGRGVQYNNFGCFLESRGGISIGASNKGRLLR